MSKREHEDEQENESALGDVTNSKRMRFDDYEKISNVKESNDASEVEIIVDNLVEQVVNNEQDHINLVPDGVLLHIFNSIGIIAGDRRHVIVSLVRTCRRWNVLLSDLRNLRMLKNMRIPKAFRWCKSREEKGKSSRAECENCRNFNTRLYALYEPRNLQFGKFELKKSDVSFISSQLELYPRVSGLHFNDGESGAFLTTFESALQVADMQRFVRNFRQLHNFPHRFLTYELIQSMIADRSFNQYEITSSSLRYLTADFGEGLDDQFYTISLENFELMYSFQDTFAICTLDEFLEAAERRVKSGMFTWSMALSSDEEEIKSTLKQRTGEDILMKPDTEDPEKKGCLVVMEKFEVFITWQRRIAKFFAHIECNFQ